VSSANSEILLELIIDISDLSIFGKDKVDLLACFTDKGIESIGLFLSLLPLLAEVSPFLFFSGELLDFLSDFVLDFLFL
jgi:hypothetical protein